METRPSAATRVHRARTRAGAADLPVHGGEPQLRAVLFDAGLTLLRTATPASEVAREALAQNGIRASTGELEVAMSIAENQIQAQWMAREWWASDRLVRELFVSAYRAGLPSVSEVGDDDALGALLADAVYDTYHNTNHWQLYPDVLPTLGALQSAGITMGIVSDWGHGLEALVLELGLSDYVDFVVVSSRVGFAKPDPEVFRLALARIETPPESAAYVGDTYVKDVLGARAAGIAPVLLDRNGGAPGVDCPTVAKLTEVLPLLGVRQPEN